MVVCWHGYLSGARCKLAYGPADATATHCLYRLVLPSWYWLTRVVQEKRAVKRVCVCVSLLKLTMDRKLILEVICNWLIDHLTSVYAYHKFVLDSTGSGRGLESASIS